LLPGTKKKWMLYGIFSDVFPAFLKLGELKSAWGTVHQRFISNPNWFNFFINAVLEDD